MVRYASQESPYYCELKHNYKQLRAQTAHAQSSKKCAYNCKKTIASLCPKTYKNVNKGH